MQIQGPHGPRSPDLLERLIRAKTNVNMYNARCTRGLTVLPLFTGYHVAMLTSQQKQRREEAATVLEEKLARKDAAQVVESLAAGLSQLRNLMFTRVHYDVETRFGMDSMLAPFSADRQERDQLRAKSEIDVFAVVVAAAEAESMGIAGDWVLPWLVKLRFGNEHAETVRPRLDQYNQEEQAQQRLLFASQLERLFPEATKAPLVTYRLFPYALCIATATAFGDQARALESRARQLSILPAIGDCHQCRGRVLDNEDQCGVCGNPLWNYEWLTSE